MCKSVATVLGRANLAVVAGLLALVSMAGCAPKWDRQMALVAPRTIRPDLWNLEGSYVHSPETHGGAKYAGNLWRALTSEDDLCFQPGDILEFRRASSEELVLRVVRRNWPIAERRLKFRHLGDHIELESSQFFCAPVPVIWGFGWDKACIAIDRDGYLHVWDRWDTVGFMLFVPHFGSGVDHVVMETRG